MQAELIKIYVCSGMSTIPNVCIATFRFEIVRKEGISCLANTALLRKGRPQMKPCIRSWFTYTVMCSMV